MKNYKTLKSDKSDHFVKTTSVRQKYRKLHFSGLNFKVKKS